jgi:hypothetical protein
VSVLCPGPVRTNIAVSGRTRPEHLREGSRFGAFEAESGPVPKELEAVSLAQSVPWLDPLDVGRMTVEAILADKLYVMTHPGLLPAARRRQAAIEAAMEQR